MTTVSSGDVAAVLAEASAVTILCHIRPDADTIGSALALGLALDRRGIRVEVAFPGPESLPRALQVLPGVELIVDSAEVTGHEVVVAVDAASADRLADLCAYIDAADQSIVIDHHISNTGFGSLDYVDATADCTALLILRVLDDLGVILDADIATCLYAGLSTDTGSFKWANPESFRVAARLLDTGIDARGWSRTLFDTHPFTWLSMVAKVLGSAQLHPPACNGAGLVYALVEHDVLADMSWEESESVIDLVRTVAEAEVAAVFKEVRPGQWTISLRSRSALDLVPIAQAHGGGGHSNAAGYSDSGTADEVVTRLVGSL
ncbi:MAG: bifunctional oligoribonuclease/PAP phosphatase NrnA [Gordonia sp. (in: high G+C Gram-positive bacteria)]